MGGGGGGGGGGATVDGVLGGADVHSPIDIIFQLPNNFRLPKALYVIHRQLCLFKHHTCTHNLPTPGQ